MKDVMPSLIKYMVNNYPHKSELSVSRLAKMLYLADWKSSIEREVQITNAVWDLHKYGPSVDNFLKIAKEDADINVVYIRAMAGERACKVKSADEFNKDFGISPDVRWILDFVIEATKNKNNEEFLKLVSSTYPVVSSSKDSDFDLVKMAHDYKAIAESSSKVLNRTNH